MSLQTEIVRSHERDEVTRVEVQCSLGVSITKPLRDYVLGKTFNRQLYLLGSLVIVTQTQYGFLLKTHGKVEFASLERLVAAMQAQAQAYCDRLEELRRLSDDVKTVCRLGLGPDLGTEEIDDLKERVDILEDLAQDDAEESAEQPFSCVQERLDPEFGEDLPSEGDSCPHSYGLNEPPPAEPDHLESPGRPLDEVVQEFFDRFMTVFNRLGRYALGMTFVGLVVAAILRVAGVF